jgi:hypothetical protein
MIVTACASGRRTGDYSVAKAAIAKAAIAKASIAKAATKYLRRS